MTHDWGQDETCKGCGAVDFKYGKCTYCGRQRAGYEHAPSMYATASAFYLYPPTKASTYEKLFGHVIVGKITD